MDCIKIVHITVATIKCVQVGRLALPDSQCTGVGWFPVGAGWYSCGSSSWSNSSQSRMCTICPAFAMNFRSVSGRYVHSLWYWGKSPRPAFLQRGQEIRACSEASGGLGSLLEKITKIKTRENKFSWNYFNAYVENSNQRKKFLTCNSNNIYMICVENITC